LTLSRFAVNSPLRRVSARRIRSASHERARDVSALPESEAEGGSEADGVVVVAVDDEPPRPLRVHPSAEGNLTTCSAIIFDS